MIINLILTNITKLWPIGWLIGNGDRPTSTV